MLSSSGACEKCEKFILGQSGGNKCVENCPLYWPHVTRAGVRVCVSQCQDDTCECPELQVLNVDSGKCECNVELGYEAGANGCECADGSVESGEGSARRCISKNECSKQGQVLDADLKKCIGKAECHNTPDKAIDFDGKSCITCTS